MRMRMQTSAHRGVSILFGFALTFMSVSAQELPPGSSDTTLFREALSEFTVHRFATSLALFNRLIREHPESERITATLIMRGKALFELGEYLESARAMKSFLATYPSSRYLADAHLALGRAYGAVGRHAEEMQELKQAWSDMPRPPAPRRSTRR